MTTNQMATVTIRDVAWKLARGGQIACVDPVDDPGVGLVDAAAIDVVWTVRRIATNQGTCDLEA